MAVDAANARALVSRMGKVRMLACVTGKTCLVSLLDRSLAGILDLGRIAVAVRVRLTVAVTCIAGKLTAALAGGRTVGTGSERLHQIGVAFRAGIRTNGGLCGQQSGKAKDGCIHPITDGAREGVSRARGNAHTNCVVVQEHRCLKVAQIIASRTSCGLNPKVEGLRNFCGLPRRIGDARPLSG